MLDILIVSGKYPDYESGTLVEANIGIMVSTVASLAMFVALWVTGNITLESVCIVVSTMNFISFVYRFVVFCKSWRKEAL